MGDTPPSKTDLMYEINYNPSFVPSRSPKVTVKTMIVDGKPSYLMKNHVTGIYYEPDEPTTFVWNLIDGKRTVKEIIEETQNRFSRVKENDVYGNLLFFAEANLLVSGIEPIKKKRFKTVSAFEMDLTLIEHSKDFLDSIHAKIQPIFKKPLLWVTVIFIVAGALIFAGEFVSIFGKKSNFEILGSTVVGFFFYYFVALAPVIAIHEIAHGLTLVHYGGQPGEMGAGLLYFGPMFYTETTDAWTLKKRHRMMVYLAGNITTLLIGSAIAFILLFVSFPPPTSLTLTMVAFYCFNMSLFNFAPPFETDGYYILSDALNMPNLRRDSYSYVGSLIKRLLRMRIKLKPPKLTRRKKGIFVAYAVLSISWILYIVFQTSLFLTYMSQDVVVALSNVFHAMWASESLPAAAVIIAVASVLYFGMQILGYGSLFSAAVKKATKKPLRIEAIHDRDLSVFAYLPPQAPESLSKSLATKMEKTAKKFTPTVESNQLGRSHTTVLRMGGANLAFVQIKDSLKHVEDQFTSAYNNLILSHKEDLQKTIGIYSPTKSKLTKLFEQVAKEATSAGNPEAHPIFEASKEKQKETLLYLLISAFGTVWTIEVQPAHEYEIQRDFMPNMCVEDLALTDLYGDCEYFKKRVVYGFDSLAKLSKDTQTYLRKSLSQPEEFQLAGAFEPIKSRITFVGRTEQLEKNLHVFAPFFVAATWSGYLDNLLTETCFTLSALNQTRLPTSKEIREMSIGELAVIAKDLSAFMETGDLIEKHILNSEKSLSEINRNLQAIQNVTKPSEDFRIGLLEAAFNVNVENVEALPLRIKEFKKEWKTMYKELAKTQTGVIDEYEKRKSEIESKKRRTLRTYPIVLALSILFVTLGVLPLLSAFWALLFSLPLVLHVFYFVAFYRARRSFRSVSKYPSQSFSRIHLFVLAVIEAIYGYAINGDILSLEK